MYFKPTQKTYYRFPSLNSINDLDSRYYFPDRTHATGESSRFENKSENYVSEHDNYINAE